MKKPRTRQIETTSPEREAEFRRIMEMFPGTRTQTQATRLLEALRTGPVNTFEASRKLGLYDPRPRVHKLRHGDGHKICMEFVFAVAEDGEIHRIGQYSLIEAAKPTSKTGGV